jgi:hypothetical protein
MTEMLDIKWDDGEVWFQTPILGEISGCEPTDYGWCGVMPDGSVLQMRAERPACCSKPNIPQHHILVTRNGELGGAYLAPERWGNRPASLRIAEN